MSDRSKDVEYFYELLTRLEERVGGKRTLADYNSNLNWPARGVYFFFEHGELRSDSTSALRVVRVGTHALRQNSWSRLTHRLTDHKEDWGRSVFRDHIRKALHNRARNKGTYKEHRHETCVSEYIGAMPFLWVDVTVKDGHILRRKIERNAVALLSGYRRTDGDQPSPNWLGLSHDDGKIRGSGLWNIQYTTRKHEPSFIKLFRDRINRTPELKRTYHGWDSRVCLD